MIMTDRECRMGYLIYRLNKQFPKKEMQRSVPITLEELKQDLAEQIDALNKLSPDELACFDGQQALAKVQQLRREIQEVEQAINSLSGNYSAQ